MDKYIKESDLFKRILNVDFKHDYEGCIKFCQSIPAADVVEVKHGRWIEKRNVAFPHLLCSECKKPFYGSRFDVWNYCPNCGAKMNEVEK